MKVEIERIRDARLEVTARGLSLTVDRLEKDGGPGDGFRATELFLGSLGVCIIGTMLTFAENQGIAIDSVSMTLEDEVARHPERIGKIHMTLEVHGEFDDRQAETMRRIARRCKIHNTLHDTPEVELDFRPVGT